MQKKIPKPIEEVYVKWSITKDTIIEEMIPP
jgi:hypothetical protein